MSNAPQGGSTSHAQGAHPVAFGGYDGPQAVADVGLSNRETLDNRVQNVDVTKVANDEPNDSDYDDPYPGGDTPSLGVPSDG